MEDTDSYCLCLLFATSLALSSGKFTDYEVRGDFGEVPLGSTKIPLTFGTEVEKVEVTFPRLGVVE